MSGKWALVAETRGVLRAGGGDLRGFLQGIVSNDVEKVTAERAIWSAFLTPQGKFLHEFFIAAQDDDFLLDCEAERLGDLKRRLSIYKLRSQVTLEDSSAAYAVVLFFGEEALSALGLPAEAGAARPLAAGSVFVDPRLAALGARAILPRDAVEGTITELGFAVASLGDYDRQRMALGVPEGSRDLEVERSILLENGFEELHGVDWDKGCFMGQELTARTKYRALIKKRLMPVEIEGPTPAPGTPILADGKEAGIMRSGAEGLGLALMRLEYLEKVGESGFVAGEAKLKPRKPDWAEF